MSLFGNINEYILIDHFLIEKACDRHFVPPKFSACELYHINQYSPSLIVGGLIDRGIGNSHSSELRTGYIGHFTAKFLILCGLISVVFMFLSLYLSYKAIWALLEKKMFKSMTSLGHVTAKFVSF